ncbi:MAG: L-threonylcarbamoyladenylate synthase [Treponema sp.]|nr:L-threonylcarbamoyladenylate synthase [Treponema sp.]
MPTLKACDESISRAAQVISRGGLVAFPTETVYGLGGDAFNPESLAKIFEAKGRPRFDPLIVHIADLGTLEKVADLSPLDAAARKNLSLLTENLWPGPLTLVLPKRKAIPDLATSGLPSVAIRLPAHETARRLIALSTGAVAAPSANPFGYLSPTLAEHVSRTLGEKVDLILDGGPSRVGLESTVLDLCNGQPTILRPGGTPKEAIEALIGGVIADGFAGGSAGALPSPGLLKSHYAPRSPLAVHEGEPPGKEEGAAFLFFDGASRDRWAFRHGPASGQAPETAVLSETGDAVEAAARLFQTLHELDCLSPKRIHAQLAPERGLGMAINDRLRRASACE